MWNNSVVIRAQLPRGSPILYTLKVIIAGNYRRMQRCHRNDLFSEYYILQPEELLIA